MPDIGPRTQQHAIRAHFHGTTVVTDSELLEAEKRVSHRFSFDLDAKVMLFSEYFHFRALFVGLVFSF